jgi:hypothetical protein
MEAVIVTMDVHANSWENPLHLTVIVDMLHSITLMKGITGM